MCKVRNKSEFGESDINFSWLNIAVKYLELYSNSKICHSVVDKWLFIHCFIWSTTNHLQERGGNSSVYGADLQISCDPRTAQDIPRLRHTHSDGPPEQLQLVCQHVRQDVSKDCHHATGMYIYVPVWFVCQHATASSSPAPIGFIPGCIGEGREWLLSYKWNILL